MLVRYNGAMTERAAEFVMPDPGVPRIPLERLAADSEGAARHVAEARPFVTRVGWPALEWTPVVLKEKVGNQRVETRDRDGNKVPVTISEYLDIVQDPRASAARYLPHNHPIMRVWGYDGPVPGMESLLPDIELPPFIRRDQVASMYVWARNLGWYDNRSHCEPNAAANLNVQLRGRKHVWLFAPEDARRIGATAGKEELLELPFFSTEQRIYHPSEQHPEFAGVRCYEAVLEAGDAVFIPPFWFHWFVHYNTYQMNFNIWFMTDSFRLSPIAAEWAYMNALCTALGGFANVKAAFARLPAETQDLLVKIANTLVDDPSCLDARGIVTAKMAAAEPALSPRLFEVAKGQGDPGDQE